MTTYEVNSGDSVHSLVASWPDLPERADHLVATFQDAEARRRGENRARRGLALPLASTAPARRRRRLHRAARPPGSPPTSRRWRRPSSSARSPWQKSSRAASRHCSRPRATGPGTWPSTTAGSPSASRSGIYDPCCGRTGSTISTRTSTKPCAPSSRRTWPQPTGAETGRARQAAWYLSAELLIDEDHSRLGPKEQGERERGGGEGVPGVFGARCWPSSPDFASSRRRSTGTPTTRSCCASTPP